MGIGRIYGPGTAQGRTDPVSTRLPSCCLAPCFFAYQFTCALESLGSCILAFLCSWALVFLCSCALAFLYSSVFVYLCTCVLVYFFTSLLVSFLACLPLHPPSLPSPQPPIHHSPFNNHQSTIHQSTNPHSPFSPFLFIIIQERPP